MTLSDVVALALEPAFKLLPAWMDSPEARVQLLAIGLQESRFQHRRQLAGGPARGFWQCEQGTQQTRGGIFGAYLHPASAPHLSRVCSALKVPFTPQAIYQAVEVNDVLAAAVARLLLATDPRRLPAVTDADGAWATYLRIWRPGQPHPSTWAAFHEQARQEVAP